MDIRRKESQEMGWRNSPWGKVLTVYLRLFSDNLLTDYFEWDKMYSNTWIVTGKQARPKKKARRLLPFFGLFLYKTVATGFVYKNNLCMAFIVSFQKKGGNSL